MILGIGCDICDIRRIEKILQTQEATFLKRVFCPSEIQRVNKRTAKAAGFAKIFAAKEAVVKALSITKNISWQDIEIIKSTSGRPEVKLHKSADAIAKSLAGRQYHIHLSMSDEYPYAMAYVILSQ